MPHSTIDVPEKLPLYIQQEMVPFPYMVFPVYVNDRDLQTFTEADHYDKLVAVVLCRPTGSSGDLPGERLGTSGHGRIPLGREIGRASCRERVSIAV